MQVSVCMRARARARKKEDEMEGCLFIGMEILHDASRVLVFEWAADGGYK